MTLFEGYIGIGIGQFQVVRDVIFAALLLFFVTFALLFSFHSRLLTRMLRNAAQVKERQSLFEVTFNNAKGNEFLFNLFMTIQSLFLCTLYLYYLYLSYIGIPGESWISVCLPLLSIFLILVLFYFFKQGIYYTIGWIFADKEQRRLWHLSYSAAIGVWGLTLYIPVIMAYFCDISPLISFFLFLFLYFLCRFVLFYKTIRIFQTKKDGFLLFFLYLCGQEITPLFLLYKGSVLLYNFIELSTLWR